MPQPLPRLRMDLDFMPSPVSDRPGLLIRDSFRYSDATLIVPTLLVECLRCFDGQRTELDLREELVRLTGQLDVSEIARHLVETFQRAGFLGDEYFDALKQSKQRAFSESPVRGASHAGAAYPEAPGELKDAITGYMAGAEPPEPRRLIAVAAPHVSPFGGWQTYRAGYSALRPEHAGKTFVILGTSHYGPPGKFGLTRKTFLTPFGAASTQTVFVDQLSTEPAANMEDYCHAVEHSIEFQVIFLQHLYGAAIKIVPILCGSFADSIWNGGAPEKNEDVKRFLGRLGELAALHQDDWVWVLGIDMAHVGKRYGDPIAARADRGEMIDVAARDRHRIARINAGDAEGFWNLIQQNRDDLKWCGSSPLYTFLRAVPEARGHLRGYQQWNIDDESVVSFAGISFTH